LYRFVFSGTPDPTVTVWVDGINRGSCLLSVADAVAADNIEWGHYTTATEYNVDSYWEYFNYKNSATNPIVTQAGGIYDDIISFKTNSISSAVFDLLRTNPASAVFNRDYVNGPTMPQPEYVSMEAITRTGATTITTLDPTDQRDGALYVVSDGLNPTVIRAQAVSQLTVIAAGVASAYHPLIVNSVGSGATSATISIVPMSKLTVATANVAGPVTVIAKMLLPSGINTIYLGTGVDDAGDTLSTSNIVLSAQNAGGY
jgi:hypothetical protein